MSYRLMTSPGKQATAVIQSRFDLTDYDLVLEIDDNSQFLAPAEVGMVTYSNGRVYLVLTAEEVDQIQTKYFRIVGLHKTNNTYFYFRFGTIDYTPIRESEILNGLVDADGNIKIDKLPMELIKIWLEENPTWTYENL